MMEVKSVTGSIVEFLRSQIITGILPPGQKLNEMQLSSSIGVSCPPLREAFRILEHEYLLANIPRKGTFVTNISIEDLKEVYEARKMIECHAIELLKAKDLRDLPRVAEVLKGVTQFHMRLVESCGNSRLAYFYKSISSNIARYQYIHASIPGTETRAYNDHQQILDFINRGLFDQAQEFLRGHLDFSVALQIQFLKTRVIDQKGGGLLER